MIGIYDYTVVLTYLSVCSAITGIVVAFNGRPFLAILCLMTSGTLDMFDGKVARTKKRDEKAISFGIQIDSLADIIAFGILPIAIGYAVGLDKPRHLIIFFIFVLGALIRLAYFNVNEETKTKNKKGRTLLFTGLPTSSVALILPLIYSLKVVLPKYFPTIYAISMLIISFLFVLNKKFITKPDNKRMIAFIIIGLIEIAIIVFGYRTWILR